ncbi:MAG: hypothetical protein ABIZ64_07215 [Casimicrobium sp.]
MMTRSSFTKIGAATLAALAITASQAQWQGIAASNAAFDAKFNAQLGAMQRQNAQSQQALWQRHLSVNGPRLRAQYAQMRASGRANMSYEQFAYWDLMTAAGSNVQGALRHQQNQFAGRQQANATVQQGYASYNAGWAQNRARQSAAVSNYTNQAIRGVSPYVDSSGRTTMLPHYLAQGQTYQSGGNVYAQDAQGTYYRQQNNGWVRMDAAQR